MTDEFFAVVDSADLVIGHASRDEVHGNPSLIHRVSHVLVFNSEGSLFLQKRSPFKDVQPDKWDTSVGGHVDFQESYLEAALRETREELGFTPRSIEFLYKYRHTNAFESEYVSTFRCIWDGPISVNPEEISEGRFWQLPEIDEVVNDSLFTVNFIDELAKYRSYLKS